VGRRLLASSCGLAELAADTPAELSWDSLPPRCVLQLHWPPTDELVSLLDGYSFKTLALARHPLDVLISILHFAQHESRTARWLNGAHGDERLLLGADPWSEAFRAYALGERAGALIDLSVHWWRSPRLDVGGRFEEIVDAPAPELTRMADPLQLGPLLNAQEATATNSFESMQAQVTNQHFWQGQPGNWRRLISPRLATEIAERHGQAFDEFGYKTDGDARLDPVAAAANWLALARPRQTAPPRTAIDDLRLRTHLDVAAIPAAGFVEQAYSLLLRRTADPHALKRAVTKLEDGTLSRARLLSELASSPEAEAVRELDDVLAFAAWARKNGERPRSLTALAGTREHLIEIPWTLARATAHGPALDVGCPFAESGYLTALISAHPGELVGVGPAMDPATPMRTVSADLRTLPFESAAFDLALAVSTIQRVGQDNRAFGLGVEHDPLGPLRALCELRRVLRHDGRLLVTVPCGSRKTSAGSCSMIPTAGATSSPKPTSSSPRTRSTSSRRTDGARTLISRPQAFAGPSAVRAHRRSSASSCAPAGFATRPDGRPPVPTAGFVGGRIRSSTRASDELGSGLRPTAK
jgi:Methyltransferase domain/Domain of unknown function (DUF4214)